MDNTELQHWGVKGMKWGVRRFQNKDGTLTAAGKKRYAQELEKLKKEEQIIKNRKKTQAQIDKLEAKRKQLADEKKALDESENSLKPKSAKSETGTKPTKKSIKDMTDDELAAVIKRAELEKRYAAIISEQKSKEDVSRGKRFIDSMKKDVIIPGAKEAGKQLVKSAITKAGEKAMSGANQATNNQQKKKKD